MSTLLEDWEEFERNVLGTDFGVAQRRVATSARSPSPIGWCTE
jgi:hypothetical protein